VASLTVTARGTAFPSVLLDVTARDAAGVAIEGLPASAFVCQEEGAAASALLLRNRRAPRVLLLLDGSASLPADFRGGGALRVIRSLADALLADVPGLRLRVRAIGERPKAEPWLTDADAIEEAARIHLPRSFESGLWQSLSDARTAADPTVVVLITDGKASDQPRPEWLARIASGPPSFLVGIGAAEKATLAALADASGGVSTSATTPDAAVAAVRRLLGERADAAHQLRYLAPANGPSTRAVRVTIAGRSVEATASYTVPTATARVRPDALAGLYVSVESGREVHLRTLAEGAPDEVEAALFGTALLAFEGGPPTAAAWLDDVFSGMLAQEPILRAIAAKDDRAPLPRSRRHRMPLPLNASPISRSGIAPTMATAAPLPTGCRRCCSPRDADPANPGSVASMCSRCCACPPSVRIAARIRVALSSAPRVWR